MNDSYKSPTANNKKAAKPIKEKQLEVLENLRDQLRLLIHLQSSITSKAQHCENPSLIEEKRLRVS